MLRCDNPTNIASLVLLMFHGAPKNFQYGGWLHVFTFAFNLCFFAFIAWGFSVRLFLCCCFGVFSWMARLVFCFAFLDPLIEGDFEHRWSRASINGSLMGAEEFAAKVVSRAIHDNDRMLIRLELPRWWLSPARRLIKVHRCFLLCVLQYTN